MKNKVVQLEAPGTPPKLFLTASAQMVFLTSGFGVAALHSPGSGGGVGQGAECSGSVRSGRTIFSCSSVHFGSSHRTHRYTNWDGTVGKAMRSNHSNRPFTNEVPSPGR